MKYEIGRDIMSDKINISDIGKIIDFDKMNNELKYVEDVANGKQSQKVKFTQEDKDVFIKMNDDTKLKLIEDLTNSFIDNKRIEENLNNMAKEMEEFRQQIGRVSRAKVDVENKKCAEDESLFIGMYEITTKLKEILIENKMSQTELCELTGINKSTMSNIISSPEKITLLNAYKIAKILNRPIEEIFQFDVNTDDL
jgi:DNA-binding XRE family transcriptional regulator